MKKWILSILACIFTGCSDSRDLETTGFRMVVDDIFNIATRTGPVVTGKIQTGSVRVGDTLILQNEKTSTTVKVISIEKFKKESLKEAHAGPDDVGIEISGVDFENIKRKDMLTK